MNTGFVNALHNPGFDFWDYGNGPFTAAGYTASRWKMALTGTPTVSVAPVANSSSISIPKWIRGRNMLQINLSSYNPSTQNVSIFQNIERGERLSYSTAIFSGIAYGPAGQHFYVSINGKYQRVDTKGDDGGVPIGTHFTFTESVYVQATEYITVEVFSRPSATGVYSIAFAQVEFHDADTYPSAFELRNPSIERTLLNRYVYPVTRGHFGFGDGATSFLSSINFPVPMRTTPTFTALLTASCVINNLSSGATVSAATPTYTIGTANTTGCRMKIDGFTATTAIPYMLNSSIGVMTADY